MVDFAIVEQGTTQHSISEVQHIHSGEAGSPAVVENLPTQVLSQDEYLFREGDLKRHAYRVEFGGVVRDLQGSTRHAGVH